MPAGEALWDELLLVEAEPVELTAPGVAGGGGDVVHGVVSGHRERER